MKKKFIFTGDLMLGGDFLNNEISENNFDKELLSNLKKANCIISNFENTIGKNGTLRKDKDSLLFCTLNTFKSYIKVFPNSIFCLGNNHINDFGERGYKKTIQTLETNNISYYGAGLLNEVEKPFVIDNDVILLNFSTDDFFVNSKIAGENEFGCCKYDIEKIKNIIDKLDLNNKILIITLHWGYEHIILPSPDQVELAHQLIELGADLIIGTHPHIIQIYENYKNKYIFYSLGNYFFPNFHKYKSGKYCKWSEKNNRSIIVEINIFENNTIQVNIIGLFFNSKKFKIEINNKSHLFLNEISKSFQNIFYKYDYTNFFKKYLKTHYPPYLKRSQIIEVFDYLISFLNLLIQINKHKHYFEIIKNAFNFKKDKNKLKTFIKKSLHI